MLLHVLSMKSVLKFLYRVSNRCMVWAERNATKVAVFILVSLVCSNAYPAYICTCVYKYLFWHDS